jgi:hypothetical protein
MSITLTPEMLSMLDSKIKEAIQLVASGGTIVKPKRVLTPEHLAAMKAGREAKAAEKAAEKPAEGSDSGSATKKRGPKKLVDMTPEERALHDAKVAERKAAKDAMTPEQKAEAKLKAEAKKAKKDSAAAPQVPAPAPQVPAPAAVPIKVKKVKKAVEKE